MSEQIIILLLGTGLMLFSATIRRMHAANLRAMVGDRNQVLYSALLKHGSSKNLTMAVEVSANLV